MFAIRRFLMYFVHSYVLWRIQPSTGLSLGIRHRQLSEASLPLGIHRSHFNIRQMQLFSRTPNGDDSGETSNSGESEEKLATAPLSPGVQVLLDPGLWASDFLALILASQLIGLLNILNSPEFVANGGWFQPIPAVPSTLDELVQRISSFGIAWAIASASVVLFAKMRTTAMTSEESETAIILKINIPTVIVFGLLVFLGNGVAFGFQGADGLINTDGNQVIPWLDALRDCYYVGLSTSGLRFLYGRYFLLS